MKIIRQNIKQSWQIIKQNKLYSFFYILGTALAISMVMVLAIGYNLRVGSIYPEVNRDRIMVLRDLQEKQNGLQFGGSFSEDVIEKLLSGAEGIEAVCIYAVDRGKQLDVQKDVLSDVKKKKVSYYNEGLWKVHQFDFIDGRPFTKEEVDHSIPQAVISESTAKSFFGDETAVGKKILVDYKECTICGVVKDVSPLVYMSYADIYLPFRLDIEPPMVWQGVTFMTGNLAVLILAKSPSDFDKIKAHIEENLAKINNTLEDGVEVSLRGGPNSFIKDNLGSYTSDDKSDSASKHILQLILVVLVIIMVPTFNISGIISSEMEDREAELGIRKAFGAPRWKLLYSLINENLLLSFMGGVLGILLSYLFIYIGYQWFLNLIDIPSHLTNPSIFPWLNIGMLINYKVIIIAFMSCLLINLLSSIIPQYISTKKNIINLLKRNNNVRGGKAPKGKSGWIFMELLAVFVIAWMAIDPIYVLNYQKAIYDGFDHKDLYVVNIPSISEKSPAYKQETEEGVSQYSKIILNIIKSHPLVENAVQGNYMPMTASRTMHGSVSNVLDSSEIKVNMLYIPMDKNYFSVQGIKTLEKLDKKDIHQNGILISKSIAKAFFGDGDAVGKKIRYNKWNTHVIGVFDDIKQSQYRQPIPTIILFEKAFKIFHNFGGISQTPITFFIKAKPGTPEGQFIKTFTEDLGDRIKIGNRYFDGVYPYSKDIDSRNGEITHQKSMYTILAYFVLFNMFLGIFATFWLQSKKRRGEIGLRMAMGSSKKKVSRMFVMESVKMASLAALVGMIVVVNIVYFKGMFTYGEYQNPAYWAVTDPTAHFVIVSLIAYAVILLTVTLGTLIPASKAANTNPVDALRDE